MKKEQKKKEEQVKEEKSEDAYKGIVTRESNRIEKKRIRTGG